MSISDNVTTDNQMLNELFKQAACGDEVAMTILRERYEPGLRFFVRRRTSADSGVLIDVIWNDVILAIRTGRVRNQGDLTRHVMTVIRALPTAAPDTVDHADSPGLRRLFENIEAHEREALRLYYVSKQPLDHICKALKITPALFIRAQFRLRAAYTTINQKADNIPQDAGAAAA